MYDYRILAFDRYTGTYTVEFLNGVREALNYNAPRSNGVYLSGQALEDAIQLLMKPFEELTDEELRMISPIYFSQEDPSTITGGEDIEAKVVFNS
jgi:hypothetical protein